MCCNGPTPLPLRGFEEGESGSLTAIRRVSIDSWEDVYVNECTAVDPGGAALEEAGH